MGLKVPTLDGFRSIFFVINIRENRRGNQGWTIQRHTIEYKRHRSKRKQSTKTQHRKIKKDEQHIPHQNRG
jgi:hypothetical protein